MKVFAWLSGVALTCVACSGADGADGTDGASYLTAVEREPAGSECEAGGVRIDTGLDADGDGAFGDDEEFDSVYVCDGAAGRDGEAGEVSDGAAPVLLATTPIEAGDDCSSGGTSIQSYRDANENDSLDDGEEVGSPSVVCNGEAGSSGTALTRVSVQAEPAGDNCETGGTSLQPWEDANDDGLFDPGEEVGTASYVCNGDAVAANGQSPIVKQYRSLNATGTFVGEGEAGSEVVLSASITIPRAGTVLALASSLAYCDDSTGQNWTCAPGGTFAFLTLVPSTSQASFGNSGEFVASLVQSGVDNQVSATAVFDLPAGTHTINAVGKTESFETAETAELYFGSTELTLLFIPNG